MLKERKALIIIFVLAFLIRLIFIFLAIGPLDGDELIYDKMALSILSGHGFCAPDGHPTAYTTPLFPMFLSGVYFLFGHSYFVVKIIEALLGSFTALIIYFISKKIFGKQVAFIAFILMALHHFFIRYSTLILSENLFIFWLSLNILFFLKLCQRPSRYNAAMFGLTCALATLTRSAYFLFVFMAVIYLFFTKKHLVLKYKELRKIIIYIFLFFIIPMSLWTARNYIVFKKFIPLATESGVVLYAAYNHPRGKLLDKSVHDDITLEASRKPEVEYNNFLLKHTLISIKNDPAKLYKYIPLKLMYFFSVFDWVAFRQQGAYNFSTAFMLPLSFLGIALAFRKKYSWLSLIPLLPFIYFLLITVLIMGVPRTRLPIEPYLIIFMALYINYLYNNYFKLGVTFVLSSWYILNLLLYVNSGYSKLFFKAMAEKIGIW